MADKYSVQDEQNLEDNLESDQENDTNLQLAENKDVESYDDVVDEYERKRAQLSKTKITKQTWSVLEIYQKIKDDVLVLNPDYQRNVVWDKQKKTAFIESLLMGIVVPPIYLVEVPGEDMLETTTYEVVDGKQRVTAINEFIKGNLKLDFRSLEYYADWFGGKTFKEINKEYESDIKEFLSQVLDIYVITSNSPDFTKYDIFSRLNKGSMKLNVNEIRRAIYQSPLVSKIDDFITKHQKTEEYKNIFTKNDTKRYYDYGSFFESIANYINTNEDDMVIEDYKSRPREMINKVLEDFQNKNKDISDYPIDKLLDTTFRLLNDFSDSKRQYYVNSIIYCAIKYEDKYDDEMVELIKNDEKITETLSKSPSTTSNVNERLKRVFELFSEKKVD